MIFLYLRKAWSPGSTPVPTCQPGSVSCRGPARCPPVMGRACDHQHQPRASCTWAAAELWWGWDVLLKQLRWFLPRDSFQQRVEIPACQSQLFISLVDEEITFVHILKPVKELCVYFPPNGLKALIYIFFCSRSKMCWPWQLITLISPGRHSLYCTTHIFMK